MCFSVLEDALAVRGLSVSVRFCGLSHIAELTRELSPHCRAAIVAGEGEAPFLLSGVRESLREFKPVCVVLGEGERHGDLFSLPDDVRIAVGAGEAGVAAARFFATVRGCKCIALPLAPSARGCFEKQAGGHFAGYPTALPDLIVADGRNMRGFAPALAETSLSLLCAEDLRIDRVFSGGIHAENAARAGRAGALNPVYGEAAWTAAAENAQFPCEALADCRDDAAGREKLFCADAIFRLLLSELPPFPAVQALEAERRKYGRAGIAFALLHFFALAYERLFSNGQPRRYFVPAYAERALRAAEYAGAAPARIFANVRIPSAEESFARVRTFAECRARLLSSARLLRTSVNAVSAAYFAAGGEDVRADEKRLSRAFDFSAELSPLFSVPALCREFGLLPNPQPTVAESLQTLRRACGR